MSVTNSKLKSLHGKARSKKLEVADRDGLVVVAGLSGKISFVFRYRQDGKSKRHTIGSYPAFSLDEARESTYKLKRLIEDGKDLKRNIKTSEKRYIADCATHWVDNYVVHLKPNTQTLYRSNVKLYFNNEMITTDIESTRFEEWIAFFDKVAAMSSRKNSGSILKTTKSMLRFCKSRGFIKSCAVFDIQLKAVGQAAAVGQRKLDVDEVAKLWIEIGRTKATPAIKSCIKLLIIFGARNSEIRGASRSEFNLTKKQWILPSERSKTGKEIRRPIPKLAESIIRELDEVYGMNGYLIPGAHTSTCMTTHSVARMCQRLWGKLHKQFGTSKFIAHDFRRTLSTRLSEQGILPHVTEKMLGHELQGVMAVYNKHDWIDNQVAAYEQWCEMILEAVRAHYSQTE